MPGRRTKNVTNPQANAAWQTRKREHNAGDTQHQWFQKEYRKACLKTRAAEGRLTEKNKIEMTRLGM
jgi:hypothetical protein